MSLKLLDSPLSLKVLEFSDWYELFLLHGLQLIYLPYCYLTNSYVGKEGQAMF